MKLKNKVIFLIILFFIIIISSIYLYLTNINNKRTIEINNLRIEVWVARTPAEKAQGLSGKKELKENEGMIFVYDDYQIRTFWMKDMLFSIDTLWLLDNEVVGIEKNIPLTEDGGVKKYHSPIPVNYVLEVSSGFANRNSINVGDIVKFNL